MGGHLGGHTYGNWVGDDHSPQRASLGAMGLWGYGSHGAQRDCSHMLGILGSRVAKSQRPRGGEPMAPPLPLGGGEIQPRRVEFIVNLLVSLVNLLVTIRTQRSLRTAQKKREIWTIVNRYKFAVTWSRGVASSLARGEPAAQAHGRGPGAPAHGAPTQ